ncbi:peptidoglycan DD-metalloendopeptidase family protein [Brevibacillus humidisoli]|uniref:murein hydrolase activator EnvC family protein n=1 Tax=Brevibacillus humidisoli TaxID=2895522 RepID=UPI001E337825|nr:peptidoglycan DD-metalloendopeptidase family protein [Brevibacillus humidisoli]UFJ40005.1 peptidoglycan DD-metalloendopeptidase family protein [Brevibacillus humidisoli]
MNKKVVFPIILTTVLVCTMIPAVGWAENSSLEKINQEIAQIRARMSEQKKNISSLEQQISAIQVQQKELEDQLLYIDMRRNETQNKLDKLDGQIEVTKGEAVKAQQQLDEAVERVAKRDVLLKTRLRAMYEHGTVSYLEVLLGSTDFSDFLNRFHALQTIFEQDKRILEENIRDKETIEAKKKEVDEHLAKLETMFAEAEKLKADLDSQYKQSVAIKAELKEKEEDLHDSLVQFEENLLAMARQEKAKLAEKIRMQGGSVIASGGKLGLPLPPGSFTFTSGFGMRTDPFTGKSAGHNGLDMAAPKGTPIYAAEKGVVILAGLYRGYGNAVIIQHDETYSTLYAHIREGGIQVKVGQVVQRGEKIAEVGSTGRSTGNHLHFTVYKNDVAIDPAPLIR